MPASRTPPWSTWARASPALDDLLAAVRRREVSAGVVTKLDRMNRGSPFLSF